MSDLRIPELSTVRTLVSVGKVPAQSVGTVVHTYQDGAAYEVEFMFGDSFETHWHAVETIKRADLEIVTAYQSKSTRYGIEVCRRCDTIRPDHHQQIGPEVESVCPECGARLFGLLGTEYTDGDG